MYFSMAKSIEKLRIAYMNGLLLVFQFFFLFALSTSFDENPAALIFTFV